MLAAAEPRAFAAAQAGGEGPGLHIHHVCTDPGTLPHLLPQASPSDRSEPDTMSEQRDVTTQDGTAWTCIEALADMPEAAKEKLAGEGRRAVVCTPSGGAHSVRLSLAEDWRGMADADLAAAIEAALARDRR
ncbi:hypothetical protein [Methylobacterium sp. ap11]|uniref:hypothetical protein n=1 Tax=Methylobacterium sp. ap11 TaxID=1761799 RepID=UPI001FCCD19C|nr:hypothetical protein [Methylobacterium sp. ap11]